mgnify:CR=1 FL=1|jgi:hypothetical protein
MRTIYLIQKSENAFSDSCKTFSCFFSNKKLAYKCMRKIVARKMIKNRKAGIYTRCSKSKYSIHLDIPPVSNRDYIDYKVVPYTLLSVEEDFIEKELIFGETREL